MMKAVRFHGQRDIRLDDVDSVQCGRDQVKVGSTLPNQNSSLARLRPKHTLSDKTSFCGNMWNRYGAAPGYLLAE